LHGFKGSESLTKYAKHLKDRRRKAFDTASKNITTSQRRQEDHSRDQVRGGTCSYRDRVKGGVPEIGDRVLVKIVAFDGTHKLSGKWEEELYLVVDQPNKITK